MEESLTTTSTKNLQDVSAVNCTESSTVVHVEAYENTYEYDPIHTGTTIRILTLYPGTASEPLRGKLNHVDLDTCPSFKALSYVWGESAERSPFNCHSKQVFLTVSLCDALRRFRLPDEDLHIWADGICVNQQDTTERNHQVRLMGRVYASAEQVLVWLGDDPTDSAKATFGVLMKKPGFDELVKCPWFSRVWVIQEAILGRDTVVYWGPEHCVSMSKLGFGTYARKKSLSYLPLPQQQVFNWVMGFSIPSVNKSISLLKVLDWVSARQCKDDRDRIYGILGLPYNNTFPWWNTWIQTKSPDYNVSASNLFLDIATTASKSGDILYMLRSVNHRVELERWIINAEPSWVPRWDNFSVNSFDLWKFANITTRRCIRVLVSGFSLQGRALHVRGTHVDEIATYSKNNLDHTDSDRMASSIYGFWKPLHEKSDSDSAGIHRINLAICAVIYNRSEEQWLKRESMSFPALETLVQKIQQDRDHATEKLHKSMYDSFYHPLQHAKKPVDHSRHPATWTASHAVYQARYLRGRSLFRTKAGLVGVGPQAMREDDIVFTLDSCDVPLIIRAEGSFFRFVGLAAILPNEWRDARNQALGSGTKLREIEIR
jgi:hypothetical protein